MLELASWPVVQMYSTAEFRPFFLYFIRCICLWFIAAFGKTSTRLQNLVQTESRQTGICGCYKVPACSGKGWWYNGFVYTGWVRNII